MLPLYVITLKHYYYKPYEVLYTIALSDTKSPSCDVFFLVARLNIVYPMLFKLTNKKGRRYTHCGVLEFVADEGKVYIPHWVSKYATMLCFKPLSTNALDFNFSQLLHTDDA